MKKALLFGIGRHDDGIAPTRWFSTPKHGKRPHKWQKNQKTTTWWHRKSGQERLYQPIRSQGHPTENESTEWGGLQTDTIQLRQSLLLWIEKLITRQPAQHHKIKAESRLSASATVPAAPSATCTVMVANMGRHSYCATSTASLWTPHQSPFASNWETINWERSILRT